MKDEDKLDPKTAAWMKDKPEWFVTTMRQCETCKLYYKPSLGHKCEGKN